MTGKWIPGNAVNLTDDLPYPRGSALLSRLINIQVARILGVAFVAVGYWEPQPEFSIDAWIEMFNKLVGFEVWGYWKFFGADDALAVIEKHASSSLSLSSSR